MNDVNWLKLLDEHLKELAKEIKRIGDILEPPKPVPWIEGEPPKGTQAQRRFMGGRFPPLDGTLYNKRHDDHPPRPVRPTNQR